MIVITTLFFYAMKNDKTLILRRRRRRYQLVRLVLMTNSNPSSKRILLRAIGLYSSPNPNQAKGADAKRLLIKYRGFIITIYVRIRTSK